MTPSVLLEAIVFFINDYITQQINTHLTVSLTVQLLRLLVCSTGTFPPLELLGFLQIDLITRL